MLYPPRVLLAALLTTASLFAAAPAPKKPAKGPIVISPGEKISMFGVEAEASKYVFVLDRSGSMGGESGKALAAAKKELVAAIDKLDRVQQFQIVFYNESPSVFNPAGKPGRLAFGTEQNKAEAKKFIESIASDGGTDHEEALALALRLRPDVIFLLTDADDPKLTARQLDRIDRIGAGVTIHTVEFGTGAQREADNFLVKLARQSLGKHVYVDASKREGGQ
jgi:hypothetical protein